MAKVVIEHLRKSFDATTGEPVRAVQDVSVSVADGEFLVLVGPSGSGKTTLLRLVAGLEQPSSGQILIDGRVANSLEPKDRDVAMVFQSPALYPHLTVYENLAFGLRLRRVPKPESERRVKAAAEMLDLVDCLDRKPGALSGGQAQRVAIGRAVVRQPKVFLLDEPLSDLDPPMRARLRDELRRLHDQLGATLLYVTHDQSEAMSLGDRIAVLDRGVLQQVATPFELYRRPENMFVAGFIGTPPMNLIRGALIEQAGRLIFRAKPRTGPQGEPCLELPLPDSRVGNLRRHLGGEIMLGLRPEHVHCQSDGGSPSGEPLITATVERVEPTGAESYWHLKVKGAALVARVPSAESIPRGAAVKLWIEAARAHYFDAQTSKALACES